MRALVFLCFVASLLLVPGVASAADGHPLDVDMVEPPLLVSFPSIDPVPPERWSPPSSTIPDHDPPEPVITGDDGTAAMPVTAVLAVIEPGSGCSRVGQFTRAELVSCFGPWAGVAVCESSGDSTAHNPMDTDGLPALGMWQFKQATWDATARHAGRIDLIGADPRRLPADVQFSMVLHHANAMGNGTRPWGCAWAYGH